MRRIERILEAADVRLTELEANVNELTIYAMRHENALARIEALLGRVVAAVERHEVQLIKESNGADARAQ